MCIGLCVSSKSKAVVKSYLKRKEAHIDVLNSHGYWAAGQLFKVLKAEQYKLDMLLSFNEKAKVKPWLFLYLKQAQRTCLFDAFYLINNQILIVD